jgi:hypothetical protein
MIVSVFLHAGLSEIELYITVHDEWDLYENKILRTTNFHDSNASLWGDV